jgi:hypothetical protein
VIGDGVALTLAEAFFQPRTALRALKRAKARWRIGARADACAIANLEMLNGRLRPTMVARKS